METIKSKDRNVFMLKYDRSWQKERVQAALDAFHMSGYRTETTLFVTDSGEEFMEVRVI